ncbi:transcription factor IIIA [Nilaparvata lugens]|uniref:transcription factor IIIA n=1 Tax=Nilaparvata lugens TaxID=108931 RepID=UPI00193CCF3A|nr:transcription factor IIIA [Nilaparvata lugens]
MESDSNLSSSTCNFSIAKLSSTNKANEECLDSSRNTVKHSSESEFTFLEADSSGDLEQSNNDDSEYNIDSEDISYNNPGTSNDESSASDYEPTQLDNANMDDDTSKIDSMDDDDIIKPSSSKQKPNKRAKQILAKNYACDYPGCTATFSRPWKLSAHHCRHTGERPFMCSRVGCTKSYTNPTHLRRHDLKVHGAKNPESDTKRYKCTHPNCWLVDHPGFCTVPGLRKHEQRHEVLDKNGLVCADCKKTFPRLNDLKTHRFEHDNILPFKCDYCGKAYISNKELRKHRRTHRRYKCPVPGCESLEFDTFKELQKHKVIHNSVIRCSLCAKEFAMQCRLRVHMEEVHPTEPNAAHWPCTHQGCSRIFTRRRNMLQHMRQKHQGQGYVCPFQACHLKFVWKQSLTKHMQLHLMDGSTVAEQPQQKDKRPRARRKDADIPKSTTAELLSSVIVDKQTKDQLLNKDEFDTDEEIIDQLTESPPPGCADDVS